jgi:hypothetical protein
MHKTLDLKLARIASDSGCRDFILADAKDADMGFGIAAPGPRLDGRPGKHPFRPLEEFRESIRQIVKQGLVDIMLMSASTSEVLTIDERLFDNSTVTPAVRANDTTDIWCGNSGSYSNEPSLPFRSATLDHIQCGHLNCMPGERVIGADLGLYSITFNNSTLLDRDTLEAYKTFRCEAESRDFRHFLEVFAPNQMTARPVKDVGSYVNDCIVRTLAGITRRGRPLFLKIPYFGPAAMESLAAYDSTLVIGILGGSAGTTMDAFSLLVDAKKYGARAALFGRKINYAEDQLAFVRYLRLLADDQLAPGDAVRAYHSELQTMNLTPSRSLENDLLRTAQS